MKKITAVATFAAITASMLVTAPAASAVTGRSGNDTARVQKACDQFRLNPIPLRLEAVIDAWGTPGSFDREENISTHTRGADGIYSISTKQVGLEKQVFDSKGNSYEYIAGDWEAIEIGKTEYIRYDGEKKFKKTVEKDDLTSKYGISLMSYSQLGGDEGLGLIAGALDIAEDKSLSGTYGAEKVSDGYYAEFVERWSVSSDCRNIERRVEVKWAPAGPGVNFVDFNEAPQFNESVETFILHSKAMPAVKAPARALIK